jgi:small subunit ribosomal protein S7
MGRKKTPKHYQEPDSVYNDVQTGKFIRAIMLKGKKTTAEKVFYAAIERIRAKITDKDPHDVFKEAIQNVMPVLEVKSRRVGGATYQVPIEIRPPRRQALAFRWLLKYSRDRAGKSMADKLSSELMDAYNKTGASIKKREDTHRMAEANKAFAHFRF